ncbi:Endoplasmic reticulum metallopeptidase 1 [Blyttiomyces sp. JEL0837]|nr:Endoplasmic reticulum metallopeptidase 1 [Blyttiomyces sp. JEL0837]
MSGAAPSLAANTSGTNNNNSNPLAAATESIQNINLVTTTVTINNNNPSTMPKSNNKPSGHQTINRNTLTIIATLILFGLSLSIFTASISAHLPTPKDPSSLHSNNPIFSGIRASNDVRSLIKIGPKPFSSKGNEDTRKFLVGALNELKRVGGMEGMNNDDDDDQRKKERSLIVETDETVVSDTGRGWRSNILPKAGRALFSLQLGNIVAKVVGECEYQADKVKNETAKAECPSLLVSAHYDSVVTSPGGTDDGMAAAVVIESVRGLLSLPTRPKHSVIFLINNAEEMGLLGAVHFLSHPWFNSVRAFINLEGAGSGGLAMAFRCSDADLLTTFSKVAPSPHASVVGNDIFKLGLIKSDTDYSIYNKMVPGLDIAFYINRYMYHTRRDNFTDAHIASVQHMGENTLAAITAIANSDTILNAPKGSRQPKSSPAIYWDELYMHMFVVPFNAFSGLVLMVFVGLCGLGYVGTSKVVSAITSTGVKSNGGLSVNGNQTITTTATTTRSSTLKSRNVFIRILVQAQSIIYSIAVPIIAVVYCETKAPLSLYGNTILWRVILISSEFFGALVPITFIILWNRWVKTKASSSTGEREPLLRAQRDGGVAAGGEVSADPFIERRVRWLNAQVDVIVSWCLVLPLVMLASSNGVGMFYIYLLWAGFGMTAILVDFYIVDPIVLRGILNAKAKMEDDEDDDDDDSDTDSTTSGVSSGPLSGRETGIRQRRVFTTPASNSTSPISNSISLSNDSLHVSAANHTTPIPTSTLDNLRWVPFLLIAVTLPLVSIMSFGLSLLRAMEPTVQDGTPAVAVTGLTAILAMPTFQALTPYLQLANQVPATNLVLGLIAGLSVTYTGLTTSRFPYSSSRPLKVYLDQEIDFTNEHESAPVWRVNTVFNAAGVVGRLPAPVNTPLNYSMQWIPAHDTNRCWNPLPSSLATFVSCNVTDVAETRIPQLRPNVEEVRLKVSVKEEKEKKDRKVGSGGNDGGSVIVGTNGIGKVTTSIVSLSAPHARTCFVEVAKITQMPETEFVNRFGKDWKLNPNNTVSKAFTIFADDDLARSKLEEGFGNEDPVDVGCCDSVVSMRLAFGAEARFKVRVDREILIQEGFDSVEPVRRSGNTEADEISSGNAGRLQLNVGCIIDDLNYVPSYRGVEELLPDVSVVIASGTGSLRGVKKIYV